MEFMLMTLVEARPAKSDGLSRRQFIGLAWAAASAALLVQAGVALYQFLKPSIQAGAFGSKLSAGDVREFKLGTVSTVREMHGFVARIGPEGVLVMAWRCPHLGCTVPWVEAEQRFNCPCHGSIYNEKGEVLGGPAPRPLDLYPAEVVGNELVVDTSRTIQRARFEPAQVVPVPPGT
jgi:cytochrome b6-f complex iron-sulfur subunit